MFHASPANLRAAIAAFLSATGRFVRHNELRFFVVTERAESVSELASALRSAARGTERRVPITEIGISDKAQQEASKISAGTGILVATNERAIDHVRRDQLDLSGVRICVVHDPELESESAANRSGSFQADLDFLFAKFSRKPQIAVISNRNLGDAGPIRRFLRRPLVIDIDKRTRHDAIRKSFGASESEGDVVKIDDAAVENLINEAIRRIHEEEDPEALNAYRRVFRKKVPFFNRAYFAAYLLKKALGDNATSRTGARDRGRGADGVRRSADGISRDGRGPGRSDRGRRNGSGDRIPAGAPRDTNGFAGSPSGAVEQESAAPSSAAATGQAGGEFASVFVGVGKNRKVFPKDIIQLFSSVDGVVTDDIGEIKILDNYSFVEVRQGKAENVISLLNGSDFRGRKLNVNFARKKD